MATMAIPMGYAGEIQFQDVEERVDFVRAGVRLSNRAGTIVRIIAKVVVFTYFLSEVVDKHAGLIDKLNGPATQNFPEQRLAELAARIEHLVKLDDDLLNVAYPGRFEPWTEMLSKLASHRDTLESMAESFRAACDPEHQALLVATLETMYT